MNWGCAAGLAEQLSFALNRPVDTILRNDNGAYATREMLSRELAQGERPPGRQEGRRLAVRRARTGRRRLETARHDAQAVAQTGESGPPTETRELIVSGTIAAKSAAPRAGQIPYAHHIFTLDLTDLQVHQRDAHRVEDRRVSLQHEKPSEYAGLLLAGRQTGEAEASAVASGLLCPIRTDQSHGN